jgi:hypothetical protein
MLNQAQLDTASFTCKNNLRPVLQCLNYTHTYTIATDTYQLIQVENIKENVEDFPINTSTKVQYNDAPCLIPVSIAKQIKLFKKSPLSILKSACTHVENGFVSLNATDLNTWQSPQAQQLDTKYPNVDVVMPTPEKLATGKKIRVHTKYLLELAKWANKHAKDGRIDIILQNEPLTPFYYEGTTKDNQKFNGLIMSCRIDN